jgi:hypothetical protein
MISSLQCSMLVSHYILTQCCHRMILCTRWSHRCNAECWWVITFLSCAVTEWFCVLDDLITAMQYVGESLHSYTVLSQYDSVYAKISSLQCSMLVSHYILTQCCHRMNLFTRWFHHCNAVCSWVIKFLISAVTVWLCVRDDLITAMQYVGGSLYSYAVLSQYDSLYSMISSLQCSMLVVHYILTQCCHSMILCTRWSHHCNAVCWWVITFLRSAVTLWFCVLDDLITAMQYVCESLHS